MAARRAAPAPRPAAHCSRTPSGADLCAMHRPNPQWAAGRPLRGRRGRAHDAVIVRRARGRVEVCRWSATGSRQQARCVPRPRPPAAGQVDGGEIRPGRGRVRRLRVVASKSACQRDGTVTFVNTRKKDHTRRFYQRGWGWVATFTTTYKRHKRSFSRENMP